MTKIVQTDVLVVGGGAAGVAAAVASAHSGLKTILVERGSFLGGKASAAIVGTICGLYYRSKNNSAEFICKGFAKEFSERLQSYSQSAPQHNSEGLHYLPYHPFQFKKLCDSSLSDAGVDVYLHTVISSCECSHGAIKTLSGLAFDTQVTFEPKAVIDCSGEAIVSHLANLPVNESEEYQAAAQVFALHQVESENENALSLSLLRDLSKAIDAGILSSDLLRSSIVPGSLAERKLFLKIALPFKITPQFNSVSGNERVARKLVDELYRFLRNNVAAFKNAVLGEVASEAGIRTGRRPIGKYILSEEDVLGVRKFENGIANGAWPIEFWEPGKKVLMNYFEQNTYYQIPATALQSPEASNLFFAGRNISADNSAIASARVIGTCLQSGYAAGKIAAAKVLKKNEAETIIEIRKEQLI